MAALILGICALLFSWVPILNLVLAVSAIILGIRHVRTNSGIAAIVTGAVALLICVPIMLMVGSFWYFGV